MLATQSQQKTTKFQKSLILYVLLILAAMWLIVAVAIRSVPEITQIAKTLPAYANLSWAHNQQLIEQLILSAGMIWFLASAVYFGLWVLSRSIRKLKGKTWLITVENRKRRRFFPALLPYLKLSCVYFSLVFLYLVLQYPLQFIIFR